MDIDKEEEEEEVVEEGATAATETVEECNARICNTMIPHILSYQSSVQGVLVNRMRNVKPWHGFVSLEGLGCSTQFEVNHTMQFRLCDASGEYTVTPGAVECETSRSPFPRKLPPNPPAPYTPKEVYPFELTVRRWHNKSPVDLELVTNGRPAGLERELVNRVMRNWGVTDAAFTVLKAGSTQDDYQNQKGQEAMGVAYVGRNFGVVSERHLKHFAPIRRQHLKNGCIPLSDEIMQQAMLPYTLVEGPTNVRRWYLVPYDSLLAWPIRSITYEKRLTKYGVMAVGPIQTHDKRSDTITSHYMLVPDCSLNLLIESLAERVVDKALPFDLWNIGVRVRPRTEANDCNWTDRSANKELTPLSTEPEVTASLEKQRSVFLRYYVRYVMFPQGAADVPNLAPRVPDSWEEYTAYEPAETPSISMFGPSNQRVK